MNYVLLLDYMEVESICSYKVEICWIMRILALFMYIENEICANELISWHIMVILLFVDIYMDMYWGLPSESRILSFKSFILIH